MMRTQTPGRSIAERNGVMMQEGSRRMRGMQGWLVRLTVTALLAYATPATHAQASSQSAAAQNSVPTLAPVVVTGELPGPALWKVSKGGHVMWILGLVTPVPRYMRWKSELVEKRIAASQAVLKMPGLEVGSTLSASDSRALMSSMDSVRQNPHNDSLQHLLPPALYKRWRSQKDRYMYGDGSVERMRPIFAGRELYDKVLLHKGLAQQTRIEKTVYEAAGHDGVKIVDPAYQLTLNDPHSALDTLEQNDMDDQHCLSMVLDAIEHDMAQTTLRANAWATGDLEGLKAVLMQPQDSCLTAISTSPFAKALRLNDIQRHIDQAWIQQAEQALTQNTQTVALLPMEQLMLPDGYLSVLRADGYTVQAPDP
jgi:hypothetical protein